MRADRPCRNWLHWLCALLALLVSSRPGRAQAEPDARGLVELKYWEKWTGVEGQAMRAIVDDFNRVQSRIHVEYVAVSSVDRKTLIATAGGNPPDIAGLFTQNIVEFGDKDALTPLDDFARGTAVDASRYLARYWDMGVYRGQLLGVVSVPALNALHWNKRLFREAGLDPERPPRTIAELDQYAERLTRIEQGRITQMGFLPSDPAWWQFFWPYFFGGELWDGDARIVLDSPENRAAYTWVQGYARRYGVSALQTLRAGFGNSASAQNPFLSQKTAMVLQGVWLSSYIERLAPDLEWGAAPFPSLHEGDPPVTFIDADMLVIPRGARHPRESFEFIRYVAERAVTEKLCLLQQKNSPLREVSEDFFARHKNPYIRMFQKLAASPGAHALPKLSVLSEYRAEVTIMFQRIWLLQATPEAALASTQARMQRSWDRARARRSLTPSRWLGYAPFILVGLVVLVTFAFAWRERRRSGQGTRVSSLGTSLAFFSPWAVGLLLFVAFPVMASVVYSFCDYSVLSGPRFVGLANYLDLLHDQVFLQALSNTLIYAACALPLQVVSAFFVALLLDAKLRGSSLYRTLIFLPSLTPLVASSLVWLWIFNAQYGVLNFVLTKLSFGKIGPVAWLSDSRTALPSLILMSVWGIGHTVVILLAAMQDVPTAVYEAAELDGASLWHKIRHITLPLTSPVIYFNGVIALIGALQVFSQPYVMTGGGPARATLSYAMYLYENAFNYLRMGYASAMAWILFLLILGLTALATRLGKSRVHYTGT